MDVMVMSLSFQFILCIFLFSVGQVWWEERGCHCVQAGDEALHCQEGLHRHVGRWQGLQEKKNRSAFVNVNFEVCDRCLSLTYVLVRSGVKLESGIQSFQELLVLVKPDVCDCNCALFQENVKVYIYCNVCYTHSLKPCSRNGDAMLLLFIWGRTNCVHCMVESS